VQSVDELNSLVLPAALGGGKSLLLIWLVGYFALISSDSFNGVLIRRDLAGLSKLDDLLFQYIPTLIPGSKYYKAKRQWKLSNGWTLKIIHMDTEDSVDKIQGADLSHICLDELRQELMNLDCYFREMRELMAAIALWKFRCAQSRGYGESSTDHSADAVWYVLTAAQQGQHQ